MVLHGNDISQGLHQAPMGHEGPPASGALDVQGQGLDSRNVDTSASLEIPSIIFYTPILLTTHCFE